MGYDVHLFIETVKSLVHITLILIIFPVTDWASRCKQIMKIWRKVSAADKVPYLVGCLSFSCFIST